MGAQGRQVEVPLTVDTSEQDISGKEVLVNIYPRKTTGGKYPFNLIGSPGLAFFCELPTFPVLQLYVSAKHQRLYAVTPTMFYQINKDGTYREIGEISVSGRVSMDDNGLQIVIVDGVKGYYYEFETDEINEIESPNFYPSASVTEQDGYFIFERSGTNQYFISRNNSVQLDGDFNIAGGKTDPLVRVISDHRELFLFGTNTTRVHYNSGDADFPFELNQGAYIEKGCAARHSVAKQNNTLYFVGSDLMVYAMAGYTPKRISTHAVEKTLDGIDVSDSFAYTHQENGHLFYTLTIPKANITWRYDISTGSWHICKDYHFGRHRSNCAAFIWNKTLVGDFQAGRVFQMVSNYYTDDGETIERMFTLPTINMGREQISLYSFELDMDVGVGLLSGQGSNPIGELEFSTDKGKTWSNIKLGRLGKMGKYLNRVKWNRLGNGRQFDIRIRITDPVPIDIGGAFIEAK